MSISVILPTILYALTKQFKGDSFKVVVCHNFSLAYIPSLLALLSEYPVVELPW